METIHGCQHGGGEGGRHRDQHGGRHGGGQGSPRLLVLHILQWGFQICELYAQSLPGGSPHERGFPDGNAAEPDLLCLGLGRCHGRHDRLNSKACALWLLYLGSGIIKDVLRNTCHKNDPVYKNCCDTALYIVLV